MMLTYKNRRCFRPFGAQSIRIVVLGLGLASLSACSDRSAHWSPVQAPKKNQVSWAEYHHPVIFKNTSAKLEKTEKVSLSRFLARVARGEGVSVMLATRTASPSSITQRREASLASHLMEHGYSVSRTKAKRGDSAHLNSIRLTVGRYIVTPPTCPDWSKDSSGDPFNRVTSNFRCASVSNLGLMVANPEALIRGTQTGPADGEAVTLGISNYRKGEVETPDATSARETIGGGGKDSK